MHHIFLSVFRFTDHCAWHSEENLTNSKTLIRLSYNNFYFHYEIIYINVFIQVLYTSGLAIIIIIIIIIIIQILYKTQGDSVASDTNGLSISDFGQWWHKEKDTILKSLC